MTGRDKAGADKLGMRRGCSLPCAALSDGTRSKHTAAVLLLDKYIKKGKKSHGTKNTRFLIIGGID